MRLLPAFRFLVVSLGFCLGLALAAAACAPPGADAAASSGETKAGEPPFAQEIQSQVLGEVRALVDTATRTVEQFDQLDGRRSTATTLANACFKAFRAVRKAESAITVSYRRMDGATASLRADLDSMYRAVRGKLVPAFHRNMVTQLDVWLAAHAGGKEAQRTALISFRTRLFAAITAMQKGDKNRLLSAAKLSVIMQEMQRGPANDPGDCVRVAPVGYCFPTEVKLSAPLGQVIAKLGLVGVCGNYLHDNSEFSESSGWGIGGDGAAEAKLPFPSCVQEL